VSSRGSAIASDLGRTLACAIVPAVCRAEGGCGLGTQGTCAQRPGSQPIPVMNSAFGDWGARTLLRKSGLGSGLPTRASDPLPAETDAASAELAALGDLVTWET